MSLALVQTNQVYMHQAIVLMYGLSPGKFYNDQYVNLADTSGVGSAFDALASQFSDAQLVTNVAANLGLSDDSAFASFMTSLVSAFGKGGAVKQLVDLFPSVSADNAYYSTVADINAKVVASIQHSEVAGSEASSSVVSNASASAGQTFSLSTGLDTPTGTSGADSFVGSNTTLNAGDSLVGGDGVDSLSVSSASGTTFAAFTTTGIETVQLSASANSTINMGGVSGETKIVARGSSADALFTNQDTIVDFELNSNSAGNSSITYVASTVSGSADVQALTFTNTTNGTVTIDGVETINATAVGESTITQLDGASATTLNISGAGDLTLSGVETTMVTINAAEMTGALDVTLGTANHTVTGGSGNDTFTFGTALTKDDTVTGGDGTDTLELTMQATTLTATDTHTVTGVETLALGGEANGALDFDAFSNPSTFTSVVVTNRDDAEDATLTDIPAGIAVTLQNASGTAADDFGTVAIDLKDFSGSADSVALTLINKQTGADSDNSQEMAIASLTANGVESMTIATERQSTSGTAEDITLTSFTANALTSLTVTGNADLQMTAPGTVTTYDASAATGIQTVTFSGTKNVTVTTGSADDVIALGTTYTDNDTINGGDGDDTFSFTQANGADDRVALTSIETITLTGPTAATSNSSTIDLKDADSVTTLTLVNGEGDITVDNILPTLTTINIDGTSAAGTAGVLTFNMDDDTSADSITIEIQLDNTGYIGDLVGNDFETVNLVFDFDASPTTTMNDSPTNLSFTDATSLVISVQDAPSEADNELDFGSLIDLKAAGAVVDLTGADINLGIATTVTAKLLSGVSTHTAASLGTAFDADRALIFDESDQVTILLNDGRDDADADDVIIDLNNEASAKGAVNVSVTGAYQDDDIDIIRFLDDGTSAKDIGNVYIGGFQDRTNFGATSADLIDLSALGVSSLADLTIASNNSTDLKTTLITAVDSTEHFAGTIILVGTSSTDISAANFTFSA